MQAELWRISYCLRKKLHALTNNTFVVGLKETLKALKKDQVTSLIIAEDVEVYLMTRVLSQINQKIYLYLFKSKHALGKHVGINVNATIVALIK